ncbi:nuclear transport factor 2 family protein [Streptomyces sp. NPDC056007]|uniref:nuclear transport factor 2 family protein n=1 Tax=Streptomyces sp. NPDC056007 TaxID=3345678 RepID=UPI0035E0E142
MSQELKDKAVTYIRALENRDRQRARTPCAETATVWHDEGKGEQSTEENIAGVEGQSASIESMHYGILRRLSQPGEVLQQHVGHVATAHGMHGEVHAAVHFGSDDAGQIERREQYADFVPAGAQDS